MTREELRALAVETLEGKTIDDALDWADGAIDLATARIRIRDLTALVFMLIFDPTFSMGDMTE